MSLPALSHRPQAVPGCLLYAAPGRSLREHSLAELCQWLEVECPERAASSRVSGLTIDSRRTAAGDVFFALPGRRSHGLEYARHAEENGAVAIVADTQLRWAGQMHDAGDSGISVPVLPVPEIGYALRRAVSGFYEKPWESLEVSGITGSLGKTSVAHFVEQLVRKDLDPAVIGSLGYRVGGRVYPAARSTPELPELTCLLDRHRSSGGKRALVEVSAQGIAQGRVEGVRFARTAFLNLHDEHTDTVGPAGRLFEILLQQFSASGGPNGSPGQAVLNIDDPWGLKLSDALYGQERVLTFGQRAEADLHVYGESLSSHGIRFRMRSEREDVLFQTALAGVIHFRNLVAAIALAHSMGLSLTNMSERVAGLRTAPGRLEKLEEIVDRDVYLDYAYTPESIYWAMQSLRPGARRLLVVFGCAGERSSAPRPIMARTVAHHADMAWATTDNPRSESPMQIFDDMRKGLGPGLKEVHFVEDRRSAILDALRHSLPGDTILIAGKGHEKFQAYADCLVPFDDAAVVRAFAGKSGGIE